MVSSLFRDPQKRLASSCKILAIPARSQFSYNCKVCTVNLADSLYTSCNCKIVLAQYLHMHKFLAVCKVFLAVYNIYNNF